MKTIENQNDNTTFCPFYNPISTPAGSSKDYNWAAIIDFFSKEYPPHIVANHLLTAYFQLSEYMIADTENLASDTMQESMYVLRRLYETSQQMHQQTDEEEDDEEEDSQATDAWVVNTLTEKDDIIEKQKQQIGALSTYIETLKQQIAAGKKQRETAAVN
ncbi:MAG: hypothetical protein LUF85_09915 [Bacteroides sp.]|nr:hypothetical protein [Bacteroides sp.]